MTGNYVIIRRVGSLPGRRTELRWLRQRLDSAGERGGASVVWGEAGVGKTRLVREATAAIPVTAWIAFPGTRFAAPGLGLKKLAELGDAEAEALGRALRAPGADDGSHLAAICDAVDRLLRSRAPAPVVFDDLQWADDLTLSWLERSGSLLESSPVSLILVARANRELPPRLIDAVAPLQRRGLAAELELGSLDLEGVEQMAQALGTRPADDLLVMLHRRSDGLPLVVEEMLRASREGLPMDTQATDPGRLGVPPVVASIVRQTLNETLGEGRRVLAAAALAPQPPSERILRDALGMGTREFDVALEQALGSELLVMDPGSVLTFRHDLQREALQAEVPLADRRDLHRRIASALQDADDPSAAQIAQQLIEAGEREAAVGWLERAADEAMETHDPGSALSYLMAAVRLGASGEALGRAVDKATIAARGANRQEDGVRLIDAALEGAPEPRLRGRLLLAESRLVLDRGDFASRLTALQEARGAFIQAGDDAGHAAALGSLTLPVDGLLPILERIKLGRQGLELAERSGDRLAIARCAGNLAAAEISEGHHRRALSLWRRAMEAADPAASPEAADEYLRNAGNRALASVAFGFYQDARRVIRDGLRIAADRHPRWAGKLRTTEALLLWRVGEWDRALERADHGHPVPETYTALVEALQVAMAFERQRRLELPRLETAAATLTRHSDHAWAAVVHALLVRIRRLRREPLPARGIVPLVEQIVSAGMRTGWEDLLPAAAEVDAATYRRVLSSLGGLAPTGLRVSAARMLADGLTETEGADEKLREAGEAFDALGEPYAAAQAFAHAAVVRRRTGGQGADLAVRAARMFHDLGARRSLALFLHRAPRSRSLEVFRAGGGGDDRRWALTPRESEVADLARRGYTAPQIAGALSIAPRTVEKHLEAVKAKLGVSRKSELVRVLSEELVAATDDTLHGLGAR